VQTGWWGKWAVVRWTNSGITDCMLSSPAPTLLCWNGFMPGRRYCQTIAPVRLSRPNTCIHQQHTVALSCTLYISFCITVLQARYRKSQRICNTDLIQSRNNAAHQSITVKLLQWTAAVKILQDDASSNSTKALNDNSDIKLNSSLNITNIQQMLLSFSTFPGVVTATMILWRLNSSRVR